LNSTAAISVEADAEGDRQRRDPRRDDRTDDPPLARGVNRLKDTDRQADHEHDRAAVEPFELQAALTAGSAIFRHLDHEPNHPADEQREESHVLDAEPYQPYASRMVKGGGSRRGSHAAAARTRQ
jgi:hypothetical protein